MIWLAIGTALLVAALLLVDRFVNANPAGLVRVLRRAGLMGGLLAAGFLALRGQLFLAAPLLVFLGPMALREFGGAGPWPGGAGSGPRPATGRRSTVMTDSVEMTLEHDTGEMDGTVRKGGFAGRTLSELAEGDLRALLSELAGTDPDAARLVDAFARRRFGAGWGGGASQDTGGGAGTGGSGTGGSGSGRAEALAVLGLEEGASAAAVREAHRRLMKFAHPDRGGSAYLAARINAAKDVLLDGAPD